MSAIYHGLHINKAKKVFQIIDHCTIYVLISGSYTPICVLMLQSVFPYNYVLLGAIYLLAALGISLNGTMMDKLPVKIVSNTLYIVMGWACIIFYQALFADLGPIGFWLFLGGGICYTVGAIFYGIGHNVKYFHSIFHMFVMLGTLLQFLAILLYGIIGL
jgi:hemolysin III